ncbi:protein SUPPRESSOR OF GENE SILENCING 3 homolog isoform X1 [Jatropha curcas]|uniref:protein SUPPRESSOR OF GENE SILENCING 3 homolog isoform X1 n=1 Tax=Jatropha curcas TaxID=180498 RepID=UPI00189336C1|nr:protein SUPPRESSOR OF GENE SILENCING 3 homolog isoform X1 [Jatropha curcas]
MAIPPESFNLLPLNNLIPTTYNLLMKNEKKELQLLSDAAMAEELQFQESLKASLLACQIPSLEEIKVQRGESSISFCEICKEGKEKDKLFKNGKCGHSFCLDYCLSNYLEAKIKEGFNIVTCPGLNCDYVLELDSFKHLLSKDVLNLWERAMSMDFTCSKELHLKTNSENVKKPANSDSDELPDTDDYDSEASPRKVETCKKSKWFKKFLKELECLSFEEIKNQARQWHCPVCQRGGGATKQYLGLQPLIQHAKTKGSTRIRLHRELAQLLEDKLHSNDQQAISATIIQEAASPKCKGLSNNNKDFEMVWPPMVVIANTTYKKDENHKRIGMTSEELLEMFSSYDGIVRVQHPYNCKGHSGFSILIFESSVKGYLEAERLTLHFVREGIGRDDFLNRRLFNLSAEQHQLYGYMAVKEDVDFFNNNLFKGKVKLKYEMRSYQEMVVNGIRQMTEENHQLQWLKNRVSEQERHTKELEESNSMLKEKLQMLTKETDNLRHQAKQHHEQSMEEIKFIEQFYKDQIRTILEGRNENDGDIGNIKQEKYEEQENLEESNANLPSINCCENSSGCRNQEITEQHKEKVVMAESSQSPAIQEMVNIAPVMTEETMIRPEIGRRRQLMPASGSEERHEYIEKLRQMLLGKMPLIGLLGKKWKS